MSGFVPAKRFTFMQARLRTIAQKRRGTIPLPRQIWVREGSVHDLTSVKEQKNHLPNSSIIGDKAFLDPVLEQMLKEQQTTLYAPIKKPKGKELTKSQKYYNRLVSKLQQPIERRLLLAD